MRGFVFSAVLVLLADQASKLWVLGALDLNRRGVIEIWPPWLSFRMAWNRGINFGLLSQDGAAGRWFLAGVALLVAALITLWVVRARLAGVRALGAGLLVGGAVGNTLDRIVHGAVADFLNVSCCGIRNPWAFNIADVAIFAGVMLLILFPGEGRAGGDGPRRMG